MEKLFQDVRYGLRTLLKKPGFTAIAILTLALGIGANTAIFTVVNSVLLQALPFHEPDRLMTLWEKNLSRGQVHGSAGAADFNDWKNRNRSFTTLAAYFNWNFNLTDVDEPRRIQAALVTEDFFQLLGVNPELGRTLDSEYFKEGNDNVVVLSHNFWRSYFGSTPNIIGQSITLNNASLKVVGVMPPNFRFPESEIEMWSPFILTARHLQTREGRFLKVIGRLKPDVSVAQAQTDLSSIAGELAEQFPDTNSDLSINLIPLHEELTGKARTPLLILLGTVGLVLLIACANVGNLLLVRAASRQKEIAIRLALGASRSRIIAQLLTESLLLAIAGGMVGLLLALWGRDLLITFSPGNIPRLDEIGIDIKVLIFTLLTSFLAAVIFGLLPALQVSKPDINVALKKEGRGSTGGLRNQLRYSLVIAEVAIGVVILIGAGLLIKSFAKLQSIDSGFNAERIVSMSLMLPLSKYPDSQKQITFFEQALERIRTLPGVVATGAIQDLPLKQSSAGEVNSMKMNFNIEGASPKQSGEALETAFRIITPDYFHTMTIPLIKGREFTPQDNVNTLPVILINQTMAERFWANDDPIGKRIRLGEPNSPFYSIIGVVADVKHMGLEAEEGLVIYQPLAQKPEWLRWMTIVTRTNAEPLNLVAAIQGAIHQVDKNQPIYDIATMEQVLSKSVARPRFSTLLMSLFAFLAIALAAIGIFGVISYTVTERTQEIGIRLALGAQRRDVSKLVVGHGMRPVLIGLVLGLIASGLLTHLMKTLLFNISPTDPFTFFSVALIVMLVALVACYIPARRATRVDPMVALRYE
jgi:putative ABC transport system permease protein